MNGGATDERARQRRGSRDIAGEECGDVPMRGIDVFIARAEARHPRPQPDGTAGHARTRSEAVATPEAAQVLGRPGGGIQASAAHSADADLRMRGRGWIRIRPCRDSDANTHR